MNACAWCGAHTGIVRTICGWDALPDQQSIWLCADRDPCRRRAETRTIHQLSTGEQP